MRAESTGRIWHGSGVGSLSGQYMTQGARGSRETLRTRPPTLSDRPEGVRGGYCGGGAFDGTFMDGCGPALGGPLKLKFDDELGEGRVVSGVCGALWIPLYRGAKRGEGFASG